MRNALLSSAADLPMIIKRESLSFTSMRHTLVQTVAPMRLAHLLAVFVLR